jgi:hypothetical protein
LRRRSQSWQYFDINDAVRLIRPVAFARGKVIAREDGILYINTIWFRSTAQKGYELVSRFQDTHVFRDQAFSLGIDRETEGYFLSTPISGAVRAVDFEAFFKITKEEYDRFREDPATTIAFVEACQTGHHRDRKLT